MDVRIGKSIESALEVVCEGQPINHDRVRDLSGQMMTKGVDHKDKDLMFAAMMVNLGAMVVMKAADARLEE